MPVDLTWVGKPFPYPMSYIVGVEKIRDFAVAIGDDNPIYHDRVAAQAAGHADLVAPPTFGVAIITRAQDEVLFNPALGLDYSRVVHGDQRFTSTRPIVAGDLLTATLTVSSVKSLGPHSMVTAESSIADQSGTHVVTAISTIVIRGEED